MQPTKQTAIVVNQESKIKPTTGLTLRTLLYRDPSSLIKQMSLDKLIDTRHVFGFVLEEAFRAVVVVVSLLRLGSIDRALIDMRTP